MSDEEDWDNMWHRRLRARLETSFPKQCHNCGHVFETAEQYFAETMEISIQNRRLKSLVDHDTSVTIEVFRKCPCGSTLMEMFEDPEGELSEEITRRERAEEFSGSMKSERSPAGTQSSTVFDDLLKSIESGLSELDLLHAEEKWGDQWYSNLLPTVEAAFPKTCRSCGHIYESPDDFFTDTGNITDDDTGMRECIDNDDARIIEVYRNCSCGSTLMDNFSDRRDMSPGGRERREKFDQMLNYLVAIGLNAETAYTELLKVARGGESKILAKIKPPK